MQTRKAKRRGGSWFSGSTPSSTAATAISNAKAKAAYNMAHSKSRVANILRKPGQVVYTNKERIQSELKDKIRSIASQYGLSEEDLEEAAKSTEGIGVKDAVDSLKTFAKMLKEKTREAAPTGGAVVLTIPLAAAQLFYKAMWVFIAFFLFWISIGGILMGADTSGLVTAALPNAGFNTTQSGFRYIRNYLKSL